MPSSAWLLTVSEPAPSGIAVMEGAVLEDVLDKSDEAVDEPELVALAGSLMVSPPRTIVAPVRAGPNPAVTRPVSLCLAPAH